MVKISTIGAVLVVLGTMVLIYVGFNYSRHEKVLDAGSLHITLESNEQSFLPTTFGALAMISGIAFIVVGAKKKP
jgi:hypothetical protein